MASKTEICNLALVNLGVSTEISNIVTERSSVAGVLRRYFDVAVESTLKDFPWKFAGKTAVLSLVEEDPNEEWGYSYQYPSDCLQARRIQSGMRNDSEETRVPYMIFQGDSGSLIFTDQVEAILEYTVKIEETDKFPSDFVLAVGFRLAALVSPAVTGGDPFKLGARALGMYNLEIQKAAANAMSEIQKDPTPQSEFIRNR